MDSLYVVYSFSKSTIPTAIRNRSYFEAHLISQLFDVVENFLVTIKFRSTALSSIEKGKYESCKASNSCGIALREKIMSSGRHLSFMFSCEPLIAGGHIKQIFIIFSRD